MTSSSLLLFCCLLGLASAKHIVSSGSSKEGFLYLGKFCFDYTTPGEPEPAGTLQIAFEADKYRSPDIMLLIYDDQPDSWPEIYHKPIPCNQRISRAKNYEQRGGIPQFFKVTWRNGRWQLPPIPIHEHSRPRFWYLVAANCRGFEDLKYEIRFLNRGGAMATEFGVNMQGLLQTFALAVIFYSVLAVVNLYGLYLSSKTQGFVHPIVKLASVAICSQFLSVLFSLIHLSKFAHSGEGAPFLEAAGQMLAGFARLVFVLLLLLLANGWTISTDEIRNRSVIFGSLAAYVVTYGLLILWSSLGRDPASTLYVYDSWPGYLIVLVDMIMGFWFLYTISNSQKEEANEAKQSFYQTLRLLYGVWFFTLPALVLTAALLSPWVRERVVTILSNCVSAVAYSTMAYLLWHTRAQKYFAIAVPDVSATKDYQDL